MKICLFILMFLFKLSFGQKPKERTINYLIGNWKCVSSNYEGMNKFDMKQYKLIKKSILHIDKDKIFYENIKFVGICNYKSLTFAKKEPTELDLYGTGLWKRYGLKDLKYLKDIIIEDKINDNSCYNDCSVFYFKNDTLINLCGGYTFFLLKIKNKK